jgi:arylsulfatase A-like enzyme
VKKYLIALTIFALAVVGCAIFIFLTKEKQLEQRPNIVIINIDSLRASRMGIYGYEKNTTPFLDSLFKKGVVFENAITPAYLTFQTNAAIFSGLYPSKNNVMQWTTPIKETLTLLPKILSFYGYQTAAFVSPSMWEKFGWSKQFDSYTLNTKMKNVGITKTHTADWMKHASSSRPFFLFWHVYDVHSPYEYANNEFITSPYTGVFAATSTRWNWEGQSTTTMVTKRSVENMNATTSHVLTSEDIEYLKGAYDSGIRHVDTQLQEFFMSIQNEPWYKNTIFIISAEHGDDLKEHGFMFHRDLYDVNTRVPLAIIGPGLSPMRIKESVNVMDIMPTAVALSGNPIPQNIDGINLLPLIKGGSLSRDIFTERPPFDEYSIRRGEWKYILRNPYKKDDMSLYDNWMRRLISYEPMTGDELYNIKNDPDEQKNLLGTGLTIEKELRDAVLLFREKMRNAREQNKSIPQVLPQGGSYIPYP